MTTIKSKAGRPKVEKKGTRHSVFLPGEISEKVEAYIETLPIRPAMSAVIARALESFIDTEKKKGRRK